MNINFDRNKSLQELEKNDWGSPIPSDSKEWVMCLEFRRIPIKDVSINELTTLISKNVSLDYLIPVALEYLHSNPLIDAGFFPGYLLATVLNSNYNWDMNLNMSQELEEICQKVRITLKIFDRNKSLEELENSCWGWEGKGKYFTTLIERCHKFRMIPIKDLNSDEICTLIRQNIGLEYLIPLALELLHLNPLNDDVLHNVLCYASDYCEQNPDLLKMVKEIYCKVQLLDEYDP